MSVFRILMVSLSAFFVYVGLITHGVLDSFFNYSLWASAVFFGLMAIAPIDPPDLE